MKVRNQKLSASFRNALEGIVVAFKTQRNIRIHVTMSIVVVLAAFYFELPHVIFSDFACDRPRDYS